MKPRDTVYRLAHSPKDYAACRALLREQGEDVRLSFPTVMAEREGAVVGFCATQPRKDAVVAGPLVVAKDLPRPGITIIRLGEAYENVMRAAGVKVYWFHVEPHMTEWADILKRVGFEPYAEDAAGVRFRRVLHGE